MSIHTAYRLLAHARGACGPRRQPVEHAYAPHMHLGNSPAFAELKHATWYASACSSVPEAAASEGPQAPRAWASSPDARGSRGFTLRASDVRSFGHDDWVLGCPSSPADLGDGREHYRHASRSGDTALFELRNAGELAQALEVAEAMRDRPSPREAGDEG